MNDLYLGDCLEDMKTLETNSVDTIITDPPYGLEFMGKGWDKGVPGVEYWAEMLRVCKPGATLLAFGGTRTFHRMTVAIEDAGWEIRDCMMWLYGSGFPKSHNLHGTFEGWGTALKPAWEPIIVAMKPLDGTFAQNAEKWGVAGINVDGGRIGTEERTNPAFGVKGWRKLEGRSDGYKPSETKVTGRWPANLILDEDATAMLDEQSGELKSGGFVEGTVQCARDPKSKGAEGRRVRSARAPTLGGASRFFYCAKASKSERNAGLSALEGRATHRYGAGIGGGSTPDAPTVDKNFHPTVKPLKLMEYLCTLTKTPTGGIVLDPFSGSGTTLLAAKNTGRPYIGMEKEAAYMDIIQARLGVAA